MANNKNLNKDLRNLGFGNIMNGPSNIESACVFDLDLTLGDFSSIMYFGEIYAPYNLIYTENFTDSIKIEYIKKLKEYGKNTNDFLKTLRNRFENSLHKNKIEEKILRLNLHDILLPLVKSFEKGDITTFVIYSNNSNLYALQYAGENISKMFKIPYLFSHYISRNDERRTPDGPSNGYRKKTFETLTNILPGLKEEKLLFMDDNPHPDLMRKNISYINVKPYFSSIDVDDIETIWNIFKDILKECLKIYNLSEDDFINLYHIRHILGVKDLDDLETKYFLYTIRYLSKNKSPFIEDKTLSRQIESYITKVNRLEGGRRKRKHTRKIRRSNKSLKSNSCNNNRKNRKQH